MVVCGVGYKDGASWQAIYDTGFETTRQPLEFFYRRCTQGPTIWPKAKGVGEL